ncbi:MAG: T9SS type A sorting domain-containing protein [Bacteroidetes bacterium]|nr:T9SS type A sorting domain-containing protein [Bacteroidota bacterium]
MKKYLKILLPTGLMAFVILMAGFGGDNLKSSGGAPAGYTNSPGDGQNCSHCMGGSVVPVTGWITSDIPADGYVPGTNYTITVTVTGTGKKGFEVSPQDLSGNLIGSLTAGTGNKLVGSGKYVTHNAAKSANPSSWTFQWSPPAGGAGNVTFYGSFIVGAQNTKTSSMTVIQSSVGIAGNILSNLSVYPNPSHGLFTVSFSLDVSGNVTLDLLNACGDRILNLMQESSPAGNNKNSFTLHELSGLYFIRMDFNGVKYLRKIIIQ